MRDPVQCPNEHHSCEECRTQSEKCPECGDQTSATPSLYLRRRIEELYIHCAARNRGCTVTCPIAQLEQHESTCEHFDKRERHKWRQVLASQLAAGASASAESAGSGTRACERAGRSPSQGSSEKNGPTKGSARATTPERRSHRLTAAVTTPSPQSRRCKTFVLMSIAPPYERKIFTGLRDTFAFLGVRSPVSTFLTRGAMCQHLLPIRSHTLVSNTYGT
eukprot:m.968761 g.968761  ORF g.968761 m.968761 type:complete len:220 (-) comp23919_c0_seq2:2656-3315(-)